jgi:hypothetical protein
MRTVLDDDQAIVEGGRGQQRSARAVHGQALRRRSADVTSARPPAGAGDPVGTPATGQSRGASAAERRMSAAGRRPWRGENVTNEEVSGGVADQGGGEVGHALARSRLGFASVAVTTRAAGDAPDLRRARDRWGRSGRPDGSTCRHIEGRYAFEG